MDFLKETNHRMDILDTNDKEINYKNKVLQQDISDLNMKTVLELQDLKNECKNMLSDCNNLHKAIYTLGAELRVKVTKTRLLEIEKSFDEMNIEDLAKHKDVVTAFEYYSSLAKVNYNQ